MGEQETRSISSLLGMWFGLRSFLVSLLTPGWGGGCVRVGGDVGEGGVLRVW